MKRILFFLLVLAASPLVGQTMLSDSDTLNEHVDSIGARQTICFDSAVYSYSIDYVVRGQVVHVDAARNCYTATGKLPKGTVLRFNKIMYTGYDGKSRKLADRKYIIK